AISALYFLTKAAHCAGVCAAWPSVIVATEGARVGNHTSYQLSDANLTFGTPRGGRRTVPMRSPSSGWREVPRRTMRTLTAISFVLQRAPRARPLSRWNQFGSGGR